VSDKKNWVDFRHVREAVDFGAVLEAYGVTLKLKSDQHHGFSPLPNHDGQKRSPSFSAHLEKKAFQCFGCQAKGNAIDFVALMEGLNPDDPHDIRKAALLIQERFLAEAPGDKREETRPPPRPERSRYRPSRPSRTTPDLSTANPPPEQPKQDNRPRIINAPLDFELKSIDPNHPYLEERGLTHDTIQRFGLGYCNRGLMAGRIAIPLHDGEGRLIGYAGRIVDESLIGEDNPKYKLPGTRERDGTVYEFSKGSFLFNGDRIEAPVADLIVVEGFFAVFHLFQCGYASAVALMGSSCSPQQTELIVRLVQPNGRVWVMPDGDRAGQHCAESVAMQVLPHRFVRWVKLDADSDPNDYSRERLAQWLSTSA
jgi:DNA primase